MPLFILFVVFFVYHGLYVITITKAIIILYYIFIRLFYFISENNGIKINNQFLFSTFPTALAACRFYTI